MKKIDLTKENVVIKSPTERLREFILTLKIDEGYDLDWLVEKFGISENTISRAARLMKAIVHVRDGKFTKTVVCHPDTAKKYKDRDNGESETDR